MICRYVFELSLEGRCDVVRERLMILVWAL